MDEGNDKQSKLQEQQQQQQQQQKQQQQKPSDLSLPPPYDVATSVPTTQYFSQQQQPHHIQQPQQQQQPIFVVIPGPAAAVNDYNNVSLLVLNRTILRTICLAVTIMLKCGFIFGFVALILAIIACTRFRQKRYVEAQSFTNASRWISLAGLIVGAIFFAIVIGIFSTSNSITQPAQVLTTTPKPRFFRG